MGVGQLITSTDEMVHNIQMYQQYLSIYRRVSWQADRGS